MLPAQPHVLRLAVGHGHEQQVLVVEGVGAEVERGVPAEKRRGRSGLWLECWLYCTSAKEKELADPERAHAPQLLVSLFTANATSRVRGVCVQLSTAMFPVHGIPTKARSLGPSQAASPTSLHVSFICRP